MKDSKIAFIDPQSYSNLEKYDLGVMSEYKDIKCDYYCSNLFSRKEITKNIKIHKIFFYSTKKNKISSLLSYIWSMILLLMNIIQSKPDVIHIQWSKLVIFDYIIYLLMKITCTKSKLIFTAHNIRPHNCSNLYFKLYKIIYNIFDIVIVHDQSSKEKLSNINNKFEIKVIRHGLIPLINNGDLDSSISNIKFSNKLSFCFIGKASYYKGFDLLIEAWNLYFSGNDEIQLIITGGIENNLNYLLKKSDKNIIFIDRFLSERELKLIVENSFFCILPYREISQSGVLLTVLSSRLPVIVSNKGGLPEPLKISPSIGIILEDLSITSIKSSIDYVINNKNTYIDVKNNPEVWNDIELHYSWSSISKKTLELYLSS